MGLFDSIGSVLDPVGDLLSISFGSVKSGSLASSFAKDAKDRLTALRSQIEKDDSIDDVSRQELLGLFSAGERGLDFGNGGLFSGIQGVASSQNLIRDIEGRLSEARRGEGKFAVRRINQNQRELLEDRPGRRQTVLSQGSLI